MLKHVQHDEFAAHLQGFPLFSKKVFFIVDAGRAHGYTPHPNAVLGTAKELKNLSDYGA